MDIEDKYADARLTLDGAIAEFFKAAQGIGMSNTEIASVVCDSLVEGSDGAVKMSGDIDI